MILLKTSEKPSELVRFGFESITWVVVIRPSLLAL